MISFTDLAGRGLKACWQRKSKVNLFTIGDREWRNGVGKGVVE